ncbi:MAG: TetR/AcrR family transcriptional regulator [Proteobacteria bacterium]|nr:TetR/AcrR family transcriptional regulator [Pseudomonadota bacterium]NCA27650.1 TetR/AcrR family transcriptional regulator [Pseudomonadota bacterium]
MARRNDHTKDEIREMVIKTGSDLIDKSGFSGFSTRQIAKEIGYTVGTLYNVFDSYDDIVFHINATTLDDMKGFMKGNLEPNLQNSAAIKQLAHLYIEFASQNYNRWSALFEYSIPEELQLPEFYNKKIDELFAIIKDVLKCFIKDDSACLKHAKIIWASIHGICILSLTKKLNVAGLNSVEELTSQLVDNYLRGIDK